MKNFRVASLVLLLSTATMTQTQGQTIPPSPDPKAPRPRDRAWSEIQKQLQMKYGKIVTIEDPIVSWPGEMAKNSLNGKLGAGPEQRYFNFPKGIESEPDIKIALTNILNVYHEQTDGPRFQILTSKLGLHLVPLQTRNADGKWSPAPNPLDEYISIPEEERYAEGHLNAICAAVAAQTSIDYKCLTPPRRFHELDRLFGIDGTFKWGTYGSIKARDAMIELLNRSESTISWESRCAYTKLAIQEVGCVLNFSGISVEVKEPDGTVSQHILAHDRCQKCTLDQPNLNRLPWDPIKIEEIMIPSVPNLKP